jgi:uncharacterized protein YndB with AHSA1/START domain
MSNQNPTTTKEMYDMDGSLESAGERWRLRFTRRLAHAPEKVWRALTEPEHLAAWFPQRIEGQWIVGAPLRFISQYGDFDGEVLAYQPPSLLEFRWGTDIIRLEVAPESQGSILTLLDTFAEQGKAARDAAGWHVCLDALEQHLAGEKPSWAPGERWQAVHGRYVERFGPEGATIGPPKE